MALTFDQISAITQEVLNESSADNVYDITPTLSHFKENGRIIVRGGDFIKLPIDTAEVSARGAFKDYDLLEINPNETGTAARYDWKRRHASVVVSRHDLLRNTGKYAAVDLVKNKVRNALNGLEKDLATDLFSTNGDSSDSFTGLRAIISTSGTIGNIAVADAAVWASTVDSAGAAVSFQKMLDRWLVLAGHGEPPDMIVTDAERWGDYYTLLTNQQRWGEAKVGKAGFRYLMFNETPVYYDPFCTSQHMFFLNSKWLYFYIHADDNFKMVHVNRPATQDINIDQVFVTGNFCTDNRRMLTMCSALS